MPLHAYIASQVIQPTLAMLLGLSVIMNILFIIAVIYLKQNRNCKLFLNSATSGVLHACGVRSLTFYVYLQW